MQLTCANLVDGQSIMEERKVLLNFKWGGGGLGGGVKYKEVPGKTKRKPLTKVITM